MLFSIMEPILRKLARVNARVETAEALFSAGKVQEAIQRLSAIQRSFPSSDISVRLRDMRHSGFFASSFSSKFESWPAAQVESPYLTGHIPEVPSSELSVDALSAGILGHGSLIVRQLLTPAQVARLIDSVDAAMEAHDLAVQVQGTPAGEWYSPLKPCSANGDVKIARKWVRDAGGVLAADSPKALCNLFEVLGQTSVISVLEGYLGERPALSVKKTTLRKVSPRSKSGWHQDGAFLGQGIRTVNVWIALSDCGTEAPSMDMVPKRLHEIVASGGGAASFSWSVDDQTVACVAGDTPPVRLQFKAGDAILFDELNLHRTATDPAMLRERYAIEAWFFAPSKYPLNQVPILF